MTDTNDETVLVVDDEKMIANLLEEYLASEYKVRIALSGEEALEKADDEVDVILLDRRMPGVSGDDVLAELNNRDHDAMVGMVSGVDADVDIVDLPFDDYLIKPANMQEVIEFVETLLWRSTLDETSQEYLALVSKKRALEAANGTTNEEYYNLVSRIDNLQAENEEVIDSIERCSPP